MPTSWDFWSRGVETRRRAGGRSRCAVGRWCSKRGWMAENPDLDGAAGSGLRRLQAIRMEMVVMS